MCVSVGTCTCVQLPTEDRRGYPFTWSWSSRPPECVLELNFHSLQGQCALKYWAISPGTSLTTFSHVLIRKYQLVSTCYRSRVKSIHTTLFGQITHHLFSDQVCTTSESISQNSQPPQMSYFILLTVWLQSSDKSGLREKGLILATTSSRYIHWGKEITKSGNLKKVVILHSQTRNRDHCIS
jgi:hypothetical protein